MNKNTLNKTALCAAAVLLCLCLTFSFAATSRGTGTGYNTSVPVLVNSVDKSRLRSSLKHLTASPRKSHEMQQATLNWIKAAIDPAGARTYFHSYQYNGKTWHNLVATVPEDVPADPGEKHLVIGAHIDTVEGSPGADDNAGGVAAVMEAVRVLAKAQLGMRVDFVFFTNEESGKIGSTAYARDARASGEDITAMIAVDMVAYGPADEDLDLVTREPYAWFAHAFKQASDLYVDLPSKVMLPQDCG